MSVDSPTPRANSSTSSNAGRLDVAVAGAAQRGGDRLADGEERRGVGREQVVGALGGLEGAHVSLVTFLVGGAAAPLRGRGRLRRIRVGGALAADGRLGAVAGQHHGRVVERQAHAGQRAASMLGRGRRRAGRCVRWSRRTAGRPRRSTGGMSVARGSRKVTDPLVWPGAWATVSSRPASSQHRAVGQLLARRRAPPTVSSPMEAGLPDGTGRAPSPGRSACRGRRGGSRPGRRARRRPGRPRRRGRCGRG